jgi:hypothetical protein
MKSLEVYGASPLVHFASHNNSLKIEVMADTDLEKRGERSGRKKNAENLYAEQSDEDDDQPQRKPRKRSKAVRSEENDGIEPNDDAFFEEGALEDTEPYEENEFEPGQIVRVYVQDFMCHHKLTIDFGRHVNFVTGANGSGN